MQTLPLLHMLNPGLLSFFAPLLAFSPTALYLPRVRVISKAFLRITTAKGNEIEKNRHSRLSCFYDPVRGHMFVEIGKLITRAP
jgi:hypothetical protein